MSTEVSKLMSISFARAVFYSLCIQSPWLGQWGVLGDDPDDGDDEAKGVRYCFCFFEGLALRQGLSR